MSAVAVSTLEVGTKLVDLCRGGQFQEAIQTLYADDVVSVEPIDTPMGREAKGLDAVKGKNKWWAENHEVHGMEIKGPYPHEDRFIVHFHLDLTPKQSGQRMQMDEVGLYAVKDGKVVREEFFYHAG